MSERSGPGKSADAYRTISEVAEELKLPQHVLRFWETRFPQVKPLKRAGGRRFYRPEDIALLQAIKAMLYGQGYTIKGVQRLLQDQGPRSVAASVAAAAPVPVQAERPRRDEAPGEGHGDPHAAPPAAAGDGAPDVSAALPPGAARRVTESGGKHAARLEAIAHEIADCVRLLAVAGINDDRL